MAADLRHAEESDLLSEGADIETGSETELLSGSDHGGARACRSTVRHRSRAFLGIAAAACLGVACALVMLVRGTAGGPTSPHRASGDAVLLDSLPSGSAGSTNASKPDKADKPNICMVDEEFFGGLCYKKCALLTDGRYPIRTTAMTCCASHPCGFFNQRHDIGFCSGFSISGGDNKACPHAPGSCLPDEELLLGQCYKKCSLLTNGKYIHRMAPGTCCDRNSELLCFLPKTGYSVSGAKYNVGGGTGAQASLHPPVQGLNTSMWTEVSTTSAPETTRHPVPLVTTTLSETATLPRVTQPKLPDWYLDMQANSKKGTTTTEESASEDAGAVQVHVVEETTTAITTVKPVTKTTTELPLPPATTATVPKDNPTPPAVPDWAKDVSATASSKTEAPKPAATEVSGSEKASSIAEPHLSTTKKPTTTLPAGKIPDWAKDLMDDDGKHAGKTRTTTPMPTAPVETTMPDWLKEIVANPGDVLQSRTKKATKATSVAPPKTARATTEAPPKTARVTTEAAPRSTAEQVPSGAKEKAPEIPDWAAEMLSDVEAPEASTVAPQFPVDKSGEAGDNSAGKALPPVPDWAKDYFQDDSS